MPNKLKVKSKSSNSLQPKSHVNIASHHFSGPIPPPDILERYNVVHPGASGIILEAFQKQSDHRRNLESIVIRQGARDSLLGLIFAFILGLSTVMGAVICILNEHQTAGTLLGGVGLTSLVGTFIYGTRSRRQERETKAKLMA